MTPNDQPVEIHANDEEVISTVMVFTAKEMIWGEVVTKKSLRVSLWLRSVAIPQFIHMYNANVMQVGPTGASKPQFLPHLFIPTLLVLAFHLKPPAADPPDFDPNEPMRKLDAVKCFVGQFQFDGFFRMSVHTDFEHFLEVSKEAYATMYDISITCPVIPGMAPIKVPFTTVRENSVLFSPAS